MLRHTKTICLITVLFSRYFFPPPKHLFQHGQGRQNTKGNNLSNLPFDIEFQSRKPLRIKVTPDLHLRYSKNGGNLGLVLKMKNIACISILLKKKKTFEIYLFIFV